MEGRTRSYSRRPGILDAVDCFCGCGTSVPRRLVGANLQASEVALELLAWDKARDRGEVGPEDHAMVEDLVRHGADRYQRLLAVVHGDPDGPSEEETADWLARSLRERRARPEMTEKGSFLGGSRLRITERDLERLDRTRPELSFTVRGAESVSSGASAEPVSGEEADAVAQLSGLAELHAAGALTDAEFAAAKARVIKRM